MILKYHTIKNYIDTARRGDFQPNIWRLYITVKCPFAMFFSSFVL